MGEAMNWSYGITTVPERKYNILHQTCLSLVNVGFDRPRIYTDGIPYKIGHLKNWMRTAFNIYISDPTADRFAVFEDDFVCCQNLREYLEAWHPEKGYLNLLTHKQNVDQLEDDHEEGWYLSNQRGRGAVALVFDNSAMVALLTSQEFINRPRIKNKQSADSVVIDALKLQGYKEWIHSPGLVQHMGTNSIMGHEYGKMDSFMDNKDPLTLLEPANA